MFQQQQTVSSLVQQVEALSKTMSENKRLETDDRAEVRRKIPETHDRAEVRRKKREPEPKQGTSRSSIYDEIDSSESDYSSAEEHAMSASEEEDVVVLEDDSLSENLAKRQKLEPDSIPENEGDNMKLLRQLGKEFKNEEEYAEKVHTTLSAVVNSGIKAPVDRKLAKELCEKQLRPEN